MTTFINCTPHALTVEGLGTLPASGIVPRCATVRTPCEWGLEENEAPAVRLVAQTMGEVTGLPAPSWGGVLCGERTRSECLEGHPARCGGP